MTQTFEILNKILLNLPAYRKQQVYEAIFHELKSNWESVTFLPKNLRTELNVKFPLTIKGQSITSANRQTTKAAIIMTDGQIVEAVLMRNQKGRNSLCVSSQVGCPMNCAFCLTGKMGFKRNLTDWEIITQILFFRRIYPELTIHKLVFMGMGEPFLNYDQVIASIKIVNNKLGFNIGARHISISTCGIIPGIQRISEESMQINLAISLHAANNNLRDQLMPVNKQYPLNLLLPAVDKYIEKTKRKVMFEYLMIKEINDSPEQAHQLAKIMAKRLAMVNLIKYNQTGVFKPSEESTIETFKNILQKQKVTVTRRYNFGQDIMAACGQLANKKE